MTISAEPQNVSEEIPAVPLNEKISEHPFIPCAFFPPAKRWRRLIAFSVDLLLLIGFCGLILWLLVKLFYGLGAYYTRGFSFMIVLAYFGYFQSEHCEGKTLGMRIMGISVRGLNGKYLSLPRSLLRGSVLAAILTFGKVEVSGLDQTGNILNLILIALGGAIVVLFLFNWKTGQSAHDLLAKSRVVFEEGDRIEVYPTKSRKTMIWAIIPGLAVGLIPLILFNSPPDSIYLKELTPYYQALKQDERFLDAGVEASIMASPGKQPVQVLEITLAPKIDFDFYKETEKVELINSVLRLAVNYLPAANYQAWELKVIRKVDFGLVSRAKVWQVTSYSNQPVTLEQITILFYTLNLQYR
jgi:uncharacterized RDD family membrane protein YckC